MISGRGITLLTRMAQVAFFAALACVGDSDERRQPPDGGINPDQGGLNLVGTDAEVPMEGESESEAESEGEVRDTVFTYDSTDLPPNGNVNPATVRRFDIDPDTGGFSPVLSGLYFDGFVATDSSSRLYILEGEGVDKIRCVEPDGKTPCWAENKGTVQLDPGSKATDLIATADKLYIPQYYRGSVVALDRATGSTLNSIPVDAQCRYPTTGVTDGARLYVSCEAEGDAPGSMAVIDQATDGVLQTLALSGTNPYRSAYSAAPRRVYVASTGTVDFAAPACVESINLAGETPVAEGCLFTSEQLGGSPLDIRVSDQDGIGAVSVIFPNEEGVLETNAQSFTLDPPALSGVFYTGEILDMDFVRTAKGLRVFVADWNGSHYAGPGADADVESIDNSMVTIGTGEGAYRIRPMRIAVARPSTERDE